MGQDLKTAQRRLKLIASVIEVFKLNREMQGILQDIHLAEKEFEIRQVEADTRLEDAQGRQKSEGVLRQLRAQRDELQLQKEITQIKAETGAIQQSVKPQGQQLTAEQQRANDKAACEARIQALKDEKQKALNLDDAAERIMRVNALDDAIQREYERWSKLV
jgi:hypothetical protein